MKHYHSINMKHKLAYTLPAIILSASLTVPVFAAGNAQQPASHVNEAEALEKADDKQQSGLADGKDAGEYLLENLQNKEVEQEPTDKTSADLPTTFDLRDRGVVTPVKFQNPFGSCWGFSAIAACETSILSSLGKTYEETGLDLSEHQLAWFARSYLQDGSSQDGEGIHMFDENDTLDTGGCPFLASSLFSSGIGPVPESMIPYRGSESLTETDGIFNANYSDQDDWSIPADYEFMQKYELIESNILPSTAVYSTDENDNQVYKGFDASAAEIWKEELMDGRAISVAFCADNYSPNGFSIMPLYLNTKDNAWAHFTYDDTASANHAVCIVGWDDTFPASKFLDHSTELFSDGQKHQPEGDGAWIVKNSWGSELSDFPNEYAWGVKDENGKSTGYFYISYYDRSLCMAETFTFDTSEKNDKAYIIDQYDYMPSDSTNGWVAESGMQMANVFTAEEDGDITAVSSETNTANTSVTYQIYLLPDDAKTPDEGTLASTIHADYSYAGYHKATLDTPVSVKQGQRYSVIVTSCFEEDDTLYYELCAQCAENQETVEEENRQIRYNNRNLPESEYADDLEKYYTKGIVNQGESYVYLDDMGQWADFSDVIPVLQEADEFYGCDFDNFPVKAYLSFADKAAAAAFADSIDESGLKFAEPAGDINWKVAIIGMIKSAIHLTIAVLLIFFLIAMIVKTISHRQQLKKLRSEITTL